MLFTTSNVVFSNIFLGVVIVFGIWLVVLSVLFFSLQHHYQRLFKGHKETNLKRLLERILRDGEVSQKNIKQLFAQVEKLEKQGTFHIQKIGIVRFNPFSETGGDHSFSLAMLDGNDVGLIITSLHTRQRTRVYVKPVSKGKSNRELSSEERQALREAYKIKHG